MRFRPASPTTRECALLDLAPVTHPPFQIEIIPAVSAAPKGPNPPLTNPPVQVEMVPTKKSVLLSFIVYAE
jgi:hypothetical protein